MLETLLLKFYGRQRQIHLKMEAKNITKFNFKNWRISGPITTNRNIICSQKTPIFRDSRNMNSDMMIKNYNRE